MQSVYIAGTGQTPVAEHWELTAQTLAARALRQALGESQKQIGALYVANALGGAIGLQTNIGPAIAAASGMRGVETFTVEAGGASGGVALRQAYLAIAGGVFDAVAVVGVEKVTDVLEGRLEAGLALSTDVDWEAIHGATPTALWASLMRRYMHEYGYSANDFAPFPVNAHANALKNPHALYRFPISADKVGGGAMVADPLSLLDCSTVADGAAAVVLVSERLARELDVTLVRLASSVVATDIPALQRRAEPLWFEAAAHSARAALRAARIEIGDVDVLELSDPHGIAAALALEASGFAERGVGVQLGKEGAIRPGGATPLATAGGFKARGDVGGASGVYQVVELVAQLRGQAGATQVADARVAFAQSLGGIATTAATQILIRE